LTTLFVVACTRGLATVSSQRTLTLFAALNAATGTVIGRCYPRHRDASSWASCGRSSATSPAISTSTWSWTITQPTKRQRSESGWDRARDGMFGFRL